MNIAQGLKEKNRIAGRIAKLQTDIFKYNCYKSDKPATLDAEELYQKLLTEKATLVNLKGKIAKANAGIADKLAELAEAKDMVVFASRLENNSGVSGYHEQVRDYNTNTMGESSYTIEYSIDSHRVHGMAEFYTERVETLQDEIDNYNATTQI